MTYLTVPIAAKDIAEAAERINAAQAAGAEMLERPMAFTGTSGTLRFDSGAAQALDAIIASGLEHHMALAYGDHRDALRSVAAAMNIPVLEICTWSATDLSAPV